MKIKEGFIIKKILDDILVFPVGENTIDCRYVLKLNETSEFLWNELSEEKTAEELVKSLLKEYDVDENTAKGDVERFIAELNKAGVIE